MAYHRRMVLDLAGHRPHQIFPGECKPQYPGQLGTLLSRGLLGRFVDARNGLGMTALHVAAIRGSSESVACLLRHGALIDCLVQGSNATPWLARGSSALHIAAAKGFTDVLATLLAALHHVPEGTLCMAGMV